MSFIAGKNGECYAPGYFLAFNDEGVARETRQFAQNSALVVTSENGAKHVPMGTAYPTNDGNAIGIAYEDVDVSIGDMPGSVVTGGAIVYEDRLAVTGAQYDAVTLKDLVSPKAQDGTREVVLPRITPTLFRPIRPSTPAKPTTRRTETVTMRFPITQLF